MLNKAFLPGGWIISYPPTVMEQLLCHVLDNPLKWKLLSSPLFKKGNSPSRRAGVPAYTARKSPHTVRLCLHPDLPRPPTTPSLFSLSSNSDVSLSHHGHSHPRTGHSCLAEPSFGAFPGSLPRLRSQQKLTGTSSDLLAAHQAPFFIQSQHYSCLTSSCLPALVHIRHISAKKAGTCGFYSPASRLLACSRHSNICLETKWSGGCKLLSTSTFPWTFHSFCASRAVLVCV